MNNNHNILCRFLADLLLQKIIMKYYDKLEPVDLKLNIFADLITNSNCDIISDKNIFKLICNISNNEFSNILKQLENDSSNKELKQQVIRLIDSKCKIKFKDDILIDNEIIKKEDLNIILNILFFIKNFDNITGHPNLNLNESLKMINIQKLPLNFEIEYLYNNKINVEVENKKNQENFINKIEDISIKLLEDEDEAYYQLYKINNEEMFDYDLLNDLNNYRNEYIIKLNKKLEENGKDLLNDFDICKLEKKVEIKDIFDIIFNNKDEIFFEKLPDFIKTLIIETDEEIKKFIKLNILGELINQNKGINKLRDILRRIILLFEDFLEFKIPKHNALKEYNKDIKLNEDNDYMNLIFYINRDFKKAISNLKDAELDCLKNDIIVEEYFLLLTKTYENEIQSLKSIIKNFKIEIIKNKFYENAELKLKSIIDLFEKEFNDKSYNDLNKEIQDNFKTINYDKIKDILYKIISNPIHL